GELSGARGAIDQCFVDAAADEPIWDALAYRERIQVADTTCGEAEGLDESDPQRKVLLYRCIHMRREALVLLNNALDAQVVPQEYWSQVYNDISRLNQQILSTLLELELTVAALVELETALDQSERLPPEDVEFYGEVRERLLDELYNPLDRFLAARNVGPWDWAAFNELAQLGNSLWLSGRPPEPQPEIQVEPDLEVIEEVVEEVVEEVAEEVAPEPEDDRYHGHVTISSEPDRAEVYLNGRRIGRTTFRDDLSSDDPVLSLTIRADGYAEETVNVDLRRGRIRLNVELEADHPFGQTTTLGDRPE
ncbi:MAG: PEGA domain-containing protein, partial [Myxococcales bacterium]|nr:PEGA domain-containing protein [Myxococcales bacterium]